MSPVRRDSTAGRVFLDLQAIARKTGRPTEELLVMYVLERFLYRLAASPHRARFVLKGGMLLAALETRRPTADIDLLANAVANDVDSVSELVRAVLEITVDDGVSYEADQLRARVIRDGELYAGVRLSAPARIGQARAVLRIDVSVGDPVTPGPVELEYPGLLDGSFHLLGYPIATVMAEKLVTMIDRGAATTRERDFADVLLLTRRHSMDAADLLAALRATARHRGSVLRPLSGLLDTLGASRQRAWGAFVARSGMGEFLPTDYSDAIDAVGAFADPLLNGALQTGTWEPTSAAWRRKLEF